MFRVVVFSACLAASIASDAASPERRALATAQAQFKKWDDSLKTGSSKTVADMYSKNDLSFLPTVSQAHIHSAAKAEAYFVDFLKNEPDGSVTDETVQEFDGGNTFLHSGLYSFMLGVGKDRAEVLARYSYMWRKENDEWKISHHHSSVLPKSATTSDHDKTGTRRAEADAKMINDWYMAGYTGASEAAAVADSTRRTNANQASEADLKLARDNFQAWNAALQTGIPDTVAAMYHTTGTEKLSFLPTVSPEHIHTLEKTKDYFVKFLTNKPFGTVTDEWVQVYDGGNAYLHTGFYTFMLGEDDGRTPVAARFSYVWRKVEGAWKITHHHSSALPPPKPEDSPAVTPTETPAPAAGATEEKQEYMIKLFIATIAMAALAAVAALAAAFKKTPTPKYE